MIFMNFFKEKMQWAGKQAENKTFVMVHTTYSRNDIGQKCEGNCDLWVLSETIKKIFPENLKTIVVAATWRTGKVPALNSRVGNV